MLKIQSHLTLRMLKCDDEYVRESYKNQEWSRYYIVIFILTGLQYLMGQMYLPGRSCTFCKPCAQQDLKKIKE